MNIFYLDEDYKKAAEYHNDKHVVKMILETAQLLCTAHHVLNPNSDHTQLYRATHKNHPCAIWVRKSINNYRWLYNLFCSLCDEYHFRYGKTHMTDKKLRKILKKAPVNIPNDAFTQPLQAMPDEVKSSCSVDAYRNYYIKHKKHLATWTKRPIPQWFE